MRVPTETWRVCERVKAAGNEILRNLFSLYRTAMPIAARQKQSASEGFVSPKGICENLSSMVAPNLYQRFLQIPQGALMH